MRSDRKLEPREVIESLTCQGVRRRRVSQILFQATIYLPDSCLSDLRSLGVPSTPASASSVNGRA